MAASLINKESFDQMFGKMLNEEMMKAAEPFMKEFLDKMEKQMRANIAANLIRFMQSDYDVQIDKNKLVIMLGKTERN